MTWTATVNRDTPFPAGMILTYGTSTDAEYVASRIANGQARLRKSNSFGSGIETAIEELHGIADECMSPGWDGYDAEPVRQETIRQAEDFLYALPLGVAAPSVGVEPDGQITFEWYQSSRRVLSVSVSPEGDLHYAAILGYSRRYGTEPFFGDVPAEILKLVQRAISG